MGHFPSRQLLRPAAGILTSSGRRIAPRTKADARLWEEQKRIAKIAHMRKAHEMDPHVFDLQQFSPGFTSYDDLITQITVNGQANDFMFMKSSIAPGLAGVWHSDWYEAGNPGAGSAPAASSTGTVYDGTSTHNNGGIGFASVSAKQRYLLSFGAMSVIANQLILVDRLMGVGSLTLTSTGSVACVSAALSRYTTGVPTIQWIEVTTAGGTATVFAAHLLSYTNQAAASGHVGVSSALAASTTMKIGDTLGPLTVAAGDTGVEATSTINVDTACGTSSVGALIWGRVLAVIPLPANTWVERDLVLQIAGLPQIFDNACLSLLYVSSAATASAITGIVRTAYE